MLLKDLQVPLAFHARPKHIKVGYHFIQEKVINKDMITKGLSYFRFSILGNKLLVTSQTISFEGLLRKDLILEIPILARALIRKIPTSIGILIYRGDSSLLPSILKKISNMPLFRNYIGICPYFDTRLP